MKKHTPEPWKVTELNIFDSDENIIASCGFDQLNIGYEGCKANAERIVHCVNAMRTIEDVNEFFDMMIKVVHERDKLQKQVDELNNQLGQLQGQLEDKEEHIQFLENGEDF
jgi:GTP1/Obg family GTP-binding protein